MLLDSRALFLTIPLVLHGIRQILYRICTEVVQKFTEVEDPIKFVVPLEQFVNGIDRGLLAIGRFQLVPFVTRVLAGDAGNLVREGKLF
jgi:hypothetical protein